MKAMFAAHPRLMEAAWCDIFGRWLDRAGVGPERWLPQRLRPYCPRFLRIVRLRAIGLAKGDGFAVPVSQSALGEATGLSTVHVNRVLTTLRQDGLVWLHQGVLTMLDLNRMIEASAFNPTYLHMPRAA